MWRGRDRGLLGPGLGGGRGFYRAGFCPLLGRPRWGVVLIIVLVLFVVLERTSVEIARPFRVPITLELEEGRSSEGPRGEGAVRTLMARSTMVTTSSEPYW